ncbi:MAG TPA: hypothetical protein P5567_11385 [Kiritimatiellia bacterium]|nr:hypothetical protein [Kiritimatiellia bacterium]HSA17462.1 hypothetical protein [Kiritimatiellia bacterium]
MPENKTETPADTPAPEAVDVKQLKTMLNLPESATDLDVITALTQLVALLQQKYEELIAQNIERDEAVANRDLDHFSDVIKPESRDFWKEVLLRNRDMSWAILSGIRESAKPPVAEQPPAPPAPVKPLFRNRLVVARTVSELAEETPAASINRAVSIRNRAHQIRTQEKIPYALAFARAEKEIE